jgi:hypothetical protein
MMNLHLLKKIGLVVVAAIPAFVNAQGSHPLFSAQIKSGEASVTQSFTQSFPLPENKMRVNRWAIPVKKGDAVLAMIKADGSGMVQYELAAQAKVLFFEEQKRNGSCGNLFYTLQ